MILVHRLRGEPMYLNPDLVESIEETPDTVLTLTDGRRTVVSDAAEDVVDRILRFRAQVLVVADQLRAVHGQVGRPVPAVDPSADPSLRVLPGGDD